MVGFTTKAEKNSNTVYVLLNFSASSGNSKLKIMKKIYFTLIWSCLAVVLFAQKTITLKWKIVDENLNPIKEVAVVKKGFSGGVDANRAGEFSIKVTPGKDTIVILSLGREPLTIPITGDTPENWIEVMSSKIFNLEGIVIYGVKIKTDYHCIDCNGIDCNDCIDSEGVLIHKVQPKIRISPNPSKDLIFIQHKSYIGNLELFSLDGKKLQSFNFAEQLNASIDLSTYPAGTYFLRSNRGWVEKVVLQK